jgi:hypothetical protein
MRRRRFLTLAGAVSLAGCSGGDGTNTEPPANPSDTATPSGSGTETPPGTPTATPETRQGTEASNDTELAASELAAARSQLTTAASAFGAEAVPLSAVSSSFAFDLAVVQEATDAAETHARTAEDAGDDEQAATAKAYLGLTVGLRALADAHIALLSTASGIQDAATAAADETYDLAIDSLAGARETASETRSSLETTITRLSSFEQKTGDAALVDPIRADIDAGLAVHAYLSVLARGRHERLSGMVDVEVGIDHFRGEDYAGATTTFAEAYGHFDDAVAAIEGYESELMAEAIAEELCLTREYRTATDTLQGGSLEAQTGNLNEGFDLYREGLSQYRNAPRYC